jgi:hypothetical protein
MPAPQDTFCGTVELNAGTKFLSPLDSVNTQAAECMSINAGHTSGDKQVTGLSNVDEFLHPSSLDEYDMFSGDVFASFQATSFDAGFWSDFRL